MNSMKLAEALLERAELQKRLAQLDSRLQKNAQVQEGDSPAEDPQALLNEQEQMASRLEYLITRINLTNAAVTIAGEPLTALLSRRDVRRIQLQQLRDFLSAASNLYDRARMSEIRIRSAVNVADMQKELDQKSKAFRELDARIQEANWTNELIE